MTSQTIEEPTSQEHDAHADEVVDRSHHLHTTTPRLLFGIFAALLVLTVITVAASRVDFGTANMLIAVLIAAIKASLVMTVFMHLKWDTAMNNIAFLGSIIFLSLLFLFSIADVATRGDADPVMGKNIEWRWGEAPDARFPLRKKEPSDVFRSSDAHDH